MLSRALSLATVTLLIGCLAAAPAQAQAQNLEAGKSPSQIFAGTCTACHKSSAGSAEDRGAGIAAGLPAPALHDQRRMAAVLTAYLISNGATDTRYGRASPTDNAKPGTEPSRTAGPKARRCSVDRRGRRRAGCGRGRGAGRHQARRRCRRLQRPSERGPEAARLTGAAGRVAKNCPKRTLPRPIRQRPTLQRPTRPRLTRQDGCRQDGCCQG